MKCSDRLWLPEWNEHVASGLALYGKDLLAATAIKDEVITLWPRYFDAPQQQRVAFWALFMAAVACPESGYKPGTMYWEAAMTRPKWSEGLFQLSYGDERGHPECKIVKTGGSEYSKTAPAVGNLHDPKVNIECAVAILNRQVSRGKGLFQGGTPYYWSVLNNGGPKVRAHWAKYVAQLK